MIFDHFNLIPFAIGLLVGLVTITWRKPDDSMRVPKWPHPKNAGQYTYRDKNGLCFSFESEEVECEKVKKDLKEYPFEN
jgi:hypothetical protein